MKPVLFAICGPTASGKTDLAIRVAQKIGAEIVSCDSMQLYTGMDILSAKPSPQELTAVRHHLIGICPPTTKYNASKFREDAERAILDIRQRGKTPLLCGGTGLYIDALTKGIRMSEAADEEMRARLKALAAQENGAQKLYEMLKKVDPRSAEKYAPNDTRRVIRSLEIYYQTGKPRSVQEDIDRETEDSYDARLFALKWEREKLYERINLRVEGMLKAGLTREVERLERAEESVQETAMQAIGFKETKQALDGEISFEDAVELIKTHTRHLAKRQETWFRRDKRVMWLPTDGTNFDELSEQIAKTIRDTQKEFLSQTDFGNTSSEGKLGK